MESTQQLPAKEAMRNLYASYQPVFMQVLELMEQKLKTVISLPSNPTYKSRIKSFDSYYKKILRKKSEDAASRTLVPLTDMIGIRVICAFLEDLDVVEKQLQAAFDVTEIERKGNDQTVKEFGYESVHVLVKIPKECMPTLAEPQLPADTVVEIQIRTILQDAWAEVEHELIYKSEFNPFDKPLRRKLASINASLTLADIIFQEIRDYQKKLQNELDFRRNTFYEKADFVTGETQHDAKQQAPLPPPESIVDTSPYTKGTIDDLVLEALHAHNTGNLQKAVHIYTQILESTPQPPAIVQSVILKHRGMAYFAQNRYDESLADFKQSIAQDPKNFRAYYYEGIVYSVQGNEKDAIKSFDASIELNAYHSHVYYRRALSYFNLGDYQKALADLDAADRLGLKSEDAQLLRSKLMKKFDMSL
ncbi:MAG TPA: (p)ppGpp synthetase [Treponema sp.]|nr:(p)ppGpp synthetase [Treponema sp.]